MTTREIQSWEEFFARIAASVEESSRSDRAYLEQLAEMIPRLADAERRRRWVLKEISAISIEIGALKGALNDAGILTSEQINASLDRQKAIADSVFTEPAAEPSSQPQQPADLGASKSDPRTG